MNANLTGVNLLSELESPMLSDGKLHRAVVRSEDFGVDRSAAESLAHVLRCEEVVDTPAYVLLSGLESV